MFRPPQRNVHTTTTTQQAGLGTETHPGLDFKHKVSIFTPSTARVFLFNAPAGESSSRTSRLVRVRVRGRVRVRACGGWKRKRYAKRGAYSR